MTSGQPWKLGYARHAQGSLPREYGFTEYMFSACSTMIFIVWIILANSRDTSLQNAALSTLIHTCPRHLHSCPHFRKWHFCDSFMQNVSHFWGGLPWARLAQAAQRHEPQVHAGVTYQHDHTFKNAVYYLAKCLHNSWKLAAAERTVYPWQHSIWLLVRANYGHQVSRFTRQLRHPKDTQWKANLWYF